MKRRTGIILGIFVLCGIGIAIGAGCCRKNPDNMKLDDLNARNTKRFSNCLPLPAAVVKTLKQFYPGLTVLQMETDLVDPHDDRKNEVRLAVEQDGIRHLLNMDLTGRLLIEQTPLPLNAIPPEFVAAARATAEAHGVQNADFWWARILRRFSTPDHPRRFTEEYLFAMISPTDEVYITVQIEPGAAKPTERPGKVTFDKKSYSRWERKSLKAIRGKPENAVRKLSPSIHLLGTRMRTVDGVDLFWIQAVDGTVPLHILVDDSGTIKEIEDLRQISVRY